MFCENTQTILESLNVCMKEVKSSNPLGPLLFRLGLSLSDRDLRVDVNQHNRTCEDSQVENLFE